MQYKIVSAVVPFDDRKDTTSIGIELLTKKVNEEIKKGWNVYGSLVVTTDVRAYRTGYNGAPNFGMHAIGFFQVMLK